MPSGRVTQRGHWGTVFTLRREPLYHKLQYSKAPKFDGAAAVLGVGLGAVGVYLGLNSLGSMGADLTDLTTFGWYLGLWVAILLQLVARGRVTLLPLASARVLGFELGAALRGVCNKGRGLGCFDPSN